MKSKSIIRWIETYCIYPSGPQRGEYVVLSQIQKDFIRQMYEGDGEVPPIIGPFAAYIALMYLCGPLAKVGGGDMPPLIETDIFTVWNATSDRLRAFLQRDGGAIVCPELGTRYPKAA